ncbi:MAG: hypothetical protein IJ837_03010 [Clostridia bacterium]|nr:hypothetical protein [Clostridia bacterium]
MEKYVKKFSFSALLIAFAACFVFLFSACGDNNPITKSEFLTMCDNVNAHIASQEEKISAGDKDDFDQLKYIIANISSFSELSEENLDKIFEAISKNSDHKFVVDNGSGLSVAQVMKKNNGVQIIAGQKDYPAYTFKTFIEFNFSTKKVGKIEVSYFHTDSTSTYRIITLNGSTITTETKTDSSLNDIQKSLISSVTKDDVVVTNN